MKIYEKQDVEEQGKDDGKEQGNEEDEPLEEQTGQHLEGGGEEDELIYKD